MTAVTILDCTLRDGGYYNSWDFDSDLVSQYLVAMDAAGVDIVELGQRFARGAAGFKGPHAFTTDDFLTRLNIPDRLKVAVMVNGADLVKADRVEDALESLFPAPAADSPVDIVRIACHFHEMEAALPAATWLTDRGLIVGFNLMQIADRSHEEVVEVARMAAQFPIDALYFADSMGSMTPADTGEIIAWLREGWDGALGIHTHDNMGLALQNTLKAMDEGATWLDATVTGMGRGPGNARTEELVMQLQEKRAGECNLVPLLTLVRQHLQPMKERFGWGTNPFYYLSGKYGIHPTYIQEMLGDARYDEEDILSVIDYLREEGGKKFSAQSLNAARSFYRGPSAGEWKPADIMAGREVLLLGTGPGTRRHADAIESYISRENPLVVAMNTQNAISENLIDLRIACHPVRLLADAADHLSLPQPLVTPAGMLPAQVREKLTSKELRDYGIAIEDETFRFAATGCTVPTSLVAVYALAMTASGQASRVLLTGFDGYGDGDRRNAEMDEMLALFQAQEGAPPLLAITPSAYSLDTVSVYGI